MGVAFGGEEALGSSLPSQCAVRDVPEGLAINLVLVRAEPLWVARPGGASSDLPQPLHGRPGLSLVEEFTAFLPLGLGFAAGAMMWLVLADLLPEAIETARTPVVAVAVVGSALAMLAFLLVLL